MKLYLAGPMTGIKEYNFPTFMRYAGLLRDRGHEVVNPAEESLKLHGIEWKGSLIQSELDALASTPWEEYLEKDLALIDELDAVAVLPGWHESPGATREAEHAWAQGKSVFHAVLLASIDPGASGDALVDHDDPPELYDETLGAGYRFIPYEENPERQRQVTGAVKDNRSKSRVDLIPSAPLVGAGRVLGYGADKYKPHNWRLGLRWSDTMASLLRHLLAFNEGEDIDSESGLPHIDHAMCQLLFLSDYFHTGVGEDDRWSSSDHEEAKA